MKCKRCEKESGLGVDHYERMLKQAQDELPLLERRIALRKKEQGMDWIYVNRTLRDQHERVLLHIKIATNMLKKLRVDVERLRVERERSTERAAVLAHHGLTEDSR